MLHSKPHISAPNSYWRNTGFLLSVGLVQPFLSALCGGFCFFRSRNTPNVASSSQICRQIRFPGYSPSNVIHQLQSRRGKCYKMAATILTCRWWEVPGPCWPHPRPWLLHHSHPWSWRLHHSHPWSGWRSHPHSTHGSLRWHGSHARALLLLHHSHSLTWWWRHLAHPLTRRGHHLHSWGRRLLLLHHAWAW